jgi:V8-like Glu-specific endopeptidase
MLSILAMGVPGLLAQPLRSPIREETLVTIPGLDATAIKALRDKNISPFTRDTNVLAEGLTQLKDAGKLSVETSERLQDLLAQPGKGSINLVEAIRRLDTSIIPKSFFEQLNKSLTPEELAAILELTPFELPRLVDPSELPDNTETVELASYLPDLNPTGRVVQGEEVPGLLPGLSLNDLAIQPGLGGALTDVAAIKSCSSVAYNYNNAYETVLKQPSNQLAKSELLEVGRQVDKFCFTPVTQPPPLELSTFGMLLNLVTGERCSAVIASTTTIVTARHCLFDDNTGTAKWADMVFRPWVDPLNNYPVTKVRLPTGVPNSIKSQFIAVNDAAEATLGKILPGTPIICWQQPTAQGQPLGMFGFFNEAEVPLGAAWTARVRVSTGGTCVSERGGGSCFVHFCNAVHGFSGSPLFAPPDGSCPGGVRIVGIHLASSGRNSECPTPGGNDAIAGLRVAGLLGFKISTDQEGER